MNILLGYLERQSVVHRLTGATKLVGMLLWSLAAMMTYDTRVLLALLGMSVAVFILSKITLRDVGFVLTFILAFLLLNNIAIFLFSPEEGVRIYGTRHELFHIAGWYNMTQEQIFYQFNVSLKYFAVIPMALLFIVTTNPSEFASSLNRIGVSYRVAYSVAIALRYIPDIQRDYRNISLAQQARGIDISRKEKFLRRVRNAASIILPLIMQSLARIEVISNAMELRGFGKHKKRSWYSARPFAPRDFVALGFVAVVLVASLVITFYDGSRYYNPFLFKA